MERRVGEQCLLRRAVWLQVPRHRSADFELLQHDQRRAAGQRSHISGQQEVQGNDSFTYIKINISEFRGKKIKHCR